MQHDDWLQAHSVYFVAFANDETLTLMAELSDCIPEFMQCVFTGIIDDTVKDEEVLVVTIASGFKK